MITLIHGEDTLSSYKRLTELIEVSKTAQLEIVVKDASELDLAQLRQDTSIVNLFGVKNCLVIKLSSQVPSQRLFFTNPKNSPRPS